MKNNTTKLDKNVLYNSGFEYYVRKEYLHNNEIECTIDIKAS